MTIWNPGEISRPGQRVLSVSVFNMYLGSPRANNHVPRHRRQGWEGLSEQGQSENKNAGAYRAGVGWGRGGLALLGNNLLIKLRD